MPAITCVVALAVLAWSAQAASGPKTVPQMVQLWLSAAGKDFKRVKSKDTFVTFTPFANRTLNTLEATGLDGSGTVFATLTPDLQDKLTKLKTDMDTLKTKQNDFSKLVTAVEDELRKAARTTAPPSIETATLLAYAVYNAAFDGLLSDKEKAAITAASQAVTATPSLPATNVTSIQAAVTALLGGPSGITKTELDIVKSDLAAIGTVLKALK